MRLLQTYSGKDDWAFWIKEGDPVWYLQSSFEEKDLAKSAGFSWHGRKEPDGKWSGKKVWYTGDRDKAAKMADYADQTSEWGKDLMKRKVELTTSLSGSRQSVSYAEIPRPEGLEYYPFQKAGVEYMMQHQNTLLGDDMGLGKTIQVLGLINIDTTIKTVLVICPATLKLNWKREMNRWFVRDMGKIGIAYPKDIPLPENGYNIVITNYETVGKINKKLTELEWDLLVVDEAHMLKNQKTIRYMSVMGGVKKSKELGTEKRWDRILAKRKVFTTGTPICNRPSELWPLISAVDPEHWNEKTFFYYHKRYCNAQQGQYGYDFKGAANETKLNELQIKLRETCMIRRLKSEVLTELPPKVRQVVELEYDENDGEIQRVLHAEKEIEDKMEDSEGAAEDAARVEIAKASGNDDEYRAAISKLAQRGSTAFEEMARVRHDTAVAKLPYAIEYVKEQLETINKAVVFCHHHDVVLGFAKAFPLESVSIYGDMTLDNRQKSIDRFQTDENCKLAIVSIMAGGVGITLTAASQEYFIELDWVPGNVTQAEDRCIVKDSLVCCLQNDYINTMSMIKIQDIKVGDRMLTHTGKYCLVKNISSHEHDGDVTKINYVGWNEPLQCTYDHKVLVKRLGKIEWVKAHQILTTDAMVFPKQNYSIKLNVVKIIPEWRIYKSFERSMVCSEKGCLKNTYSRGMCKNHYREMLKKKDRPKKPEQINPRYVRLPDVIEINDNWLYLFGWFVAEGFSSILPGKSKFVSFSGHEKEENILLGIAKTLSKIGIKSTIYRNKKTHGIEMRSYSGELALWFRDWFGHGAKNKILPEELLMLPPKQAVVFLKGYTDGDGYQRKKQVEWVSASPVLCYQMCQMAIKAGFIPTMRRGSVKSGNHWIGGYTKFSTCDNERLRDQDDLYIYRPVRKVETKQEKVMVYDLEVEEDHSFTVGFATVHNCHRIGQKDVVNIQHLVLKDSLDVKMAQTIIAKQKIIEATLDKILESEPVIPQKQKAVTASLSRQKISEEAELITETEVEEIHEKLKTIAAMDRDHARCVNGIGFNKIDGYMGHQLAQTMFLSKKQAVIGKRLVKKYAGQLQKLQTVEDW